MILIPTEAVLAEALADAWEKWQVADARLYQKMERHLERSWSVRNRTAVGQYVYVRRFVERYFRWRSQTQRRRSWITDLSQQMAQQGEDFFRHCLSQTPRRTQVIFALWSEGMSPSAIALFLRENEVAIHVEIERIKGHLKEGVIAK